MASAKSAPRAASISSTAVGTRARRRAVLLAAVLLVAAAGTAAWLLMADSPPSAGVPAPVGAPGSAGAGGVWEVPDSEPADVSWVPVYLPRLSGWVPRSTVHGPRRRGLGEWGGWAQTPMGAVMAAHTISLGWGLDNTAARDYLLERLLTVPAFWDQTVGQRPGDGLAPVVGSWPVGFRVDDYTVGTARVTLAASSSLPGSAEQTSSTTYTLLWESGDWRVVFNPTDHPRLSSGSAPGLIGWGPPR